MIATTLQEALAGQAHRAEATVTFGTSARRERLTYPSSTRRSPRRPAASPTRAYAAGTGCCCASAAPGRGCSPCSA